MAATNVSKYHYTQRITGTLPAYLIRHDKPGLFVIPGGALILFSGPRIAVAAPGPAPLSEGNR